MQYKHLYYNYNNDVQLCSLQVLREVDAILFSLLILSGLTDSKGRVWRCHPSQMYAVEVTLPEIQVCMCNQLL